MNFERLLSQTLLSWIVILLTAQIGGRVAQRVGQPRVIGEILGGILLGPSALGGCFPAVLHQLFPLEVQPSLQLLARIGLVLFMFQVGMEFDYAHLRTRSRTVGAVSLLGIAAPCLCGLLLGPWLHREFAQSTNFVAFQFFICIALSISALPVMGRILLEMGWERTELGTMAISAAAIDDAAGWLLLGAAMQLAAYQMNAWRLIAQMIGILTLSVGVLWAGKILARSVWRRSRERLTPETFVFLLVLLFACSLASAALGIFSVFGAFLLGVAFHRETGLVRAWREKLGDFVTAALVPIFFTLTGLRTEIGSLSTGTAWLGFALVLLAGMAGKLGGCWLGGRLTGQTQAVSACIAALMNGRGMMGLVAINIGYDLHLLTRSLFTMFVFMAVLTTLMIKPLLRLWMPAELAKKSKPDVGVMDTAQTVL